MRRFLNCCIALLTLCAARGQEAIPEVRPSIARIANGLDKGNTLHLGWPVGIGGEFENNKYVRRYQKLDRRATNEELVALTYNKSGLIKLYAFTILADRRHLDLYSIYLRNRKDERSFFLPSGCMGASFQVNAYMKANLSSTRGGRLAGLFAKPRS